MRRSMILVYLFILEGCSSLGLPRTLGEQASAYGYVPLDGLPVHTNPGSATCLDYTKTPPILKSPPPYVPLPQALPDISVRFAIANVNEGGNLSYGPAQVTVANQDYRAVLDYVSVDAVPEFFYIRKLSRYYDRTLKQWSDPRPVDPTQAIPAGSINTYSVRFIDPKLIHPSQEKAEAASPAQMALADNHSTARASLIQQLTGIRVSDESSEADALSRNNWYLVTIPIYVGIGTRLTADLHSLKGGLTITSLASIGASANGSRLVGRMSVQTIGVNSQTVAVGLPISSQLDQTSIESAILAVGNSRAEFYHMADNSGNAYPAVRVVGLYSPIGTDAALINGIYSELASANIQWARPCIAPGFNAPPAASPAPKNKTAAPNASHAAKPSSVNKRPKPKAAAVVATRSTVSKSPRTKAAPVAAKRAGPKK
jgi:hypothetical protein